MMSICFCESKPLPNPCEFLTGLGITVEVSEGRPHENEEDGQEAAGQRGHDRDLCFLGLARLDRNSKGTKSQFLNQNQ